MAPNPVILRQLYMELNLFVTRTGDDFGDRQFIESAKRMHPLSLWELIGQAPHLKQVALRIFRMPPSASGGTIGLNLFVDCDLVIGERNFKARKHVQNFSRNSLGETKTDQQTFILYNDKMLQQNIAQ